MKIADKRFLALDGLKNPEDYVICTYTFQTYKDVFETALDLCKSQSTSSSGWGSSGEVKDENDEIVDKFGAKLLSYEVIETSTSPDLPCTRLGMRKGKFTRAKTKLAIPIRNFGYSIPALLTATAGEIHYLDIFVSVKLEDMEYPPNFLEQYQGPQFGLEGVRKLLEISEDRPIFIAVVKPSIAPSKMFADLAYEALIGGADIVKDDELLADIPDSPLAERVEMVMQAVKKAEEVTGKKKFYQVNITGDVADLKKFYEIAEKYKVNCIMVNAMAIGLSATKMVREFSKVPIASHFDLNGAFGRLPFFGISHKVLATLHRMAGIDNLIMPVYSSTMSEFEHDTDLDLNEIEIQVKSCLEPLGNLKTTTPVFGGGLRAANIEKVLKIAKTNKIGLIVGHGIFAHPDGAKAGSQSLIQAWEAYRDKISLEEYAKTHTELRHALEHFERKFGK